jgi:hypothetical protein
MSKKESIVEWISRVGFWRLILYKLLIPPWKFVIERLEDTLALFRKACEKLGI